MTNIYLIFLVKNIRIKIEFKREINMSVLIRVWYTFALQM